VKTSRPRGDVAARAGVVRGEADGLHRGERRPEGRDQQHRQPEAEHQGGQPLPAQHLDHRVGAVPPDHHQHEQEQHHDRAGVDDDLHEAEERRLLDHVQRAEREHRQHQEQRRVHGVLGEDHAERAEQRQRAEDPEGHGLASGHRVLDVLRQNESSAHLTSPFTGSG